VVHYPHYGNQGGTPGAYIRDGGWKLIHFFEDDHVEFYDLAEDIGEKRNLSAEKPEKAAELLAKLQSRQTEVSARLPTPNPDY
jgi:arylsulfatase A